MRYMAPELLIIPDESDDDDNFITVMKETDVYSFSMVGVEVSLFQITRIPAFQGHTHRFYLENNLIPR